MWPQPANIVIYIIINEVCGNPPSRKGFPPYRSFTLLCRILCLNAIVESTQDFLLLDLLDEFGPCVRSKGVSFQTYINAQNFWREEGFAPRSSS